MVDFKKIIEGRIRFSKYFVIFIFILISLVTGSTYAYYAFQEEDSVVIKGNIISIDADLDVKLVVGTNEKMVPMQDAALANALKGTGSTNGACIDNVGNLSCQVYQITLTNNGSKLKNLEGSIELYPKEGTGNAYSNLKWRELENPTTIKSGSAINGMSKSMLVSRLILESKKTKTWYVAVWLSETDSDQYDIDKGFFEGIVNFEVAPIKENVFAKTIMAPAAQSDARIIFTKPSSTSGTNGIYLRSGTEDYVYPIYYYRGNVNNNLIFADFCWKVVRTTETGGLKLIYNGTPIVTETGKSCNNTGESSQIGTIAFNSLSNSISGLSYMYSNSYIGSNRRMSSTDNYVYGNDVIYSNGTYNLVNTISDTWGNLYESGLTNNHYTCFSTGTTCEMVSYVYQTTSDYAYYVLLTGGVNIEEALEEMLGSDEKDVSKYNKISSTIKGNKDTPGTLDWWYYNNIEQDYSDYIEDTVWCYDRAISKLGGFNPNGGDTNGNLDLNRILGTPVLTCSRNIDKFTVDRLNGNGSLDYPVGLLIYEETILAGAGVGDNSNYYLYTGINYWTSSAYAFFTYPSVTYVSSKGRAASDKSAIKRGVRPSISLAPGFSLVGDGDGTVDNPYVVE